MTVYREDGRAPCLPRAALPRLIDAVYTRRGWTDHGVPTEAKLRELGD